MAKKSETLEQRSAAVRRRARRFLARPRFPLTVAAAGSIWEVERNLNLAEPSTPEILEEVLAGRFWNCGHGFHQAANMDPSAHFPLSGCDSIVAPMSLLCLDTEVVTSFLHEVSVRQLVQDANQLAPEASAAESVGV